ncbi:MAG: hypothetical protein EKK62_03160 [Acidimicrobiia bacterium]|nr:MAG: hypothetical protein EKK62_03160 [Acidimicrobiia bacterium]
MPQATVNLLEKVSTLLPSAANEFAVCGVCSVGDPTREYVFDPDAPASVIRASLGDGDAVEGLVTLLRYGRRRAVFFPVVSSVAGSIGAVTKVRPSNPLALLPNLTPSAITASGDVLEDGPYHSGHVCLLITESGAEGVAKFRYSLDHQIKDGELVGTFSGDITVPKASAAVVIGTVDLSTITSWGNGGTLDTLTLIVNSDSDGGTSVTTTFADPADADDVVDQLNANNASGTKYLAALVGANKLAIYSITTGTAGTLTITGTACTAVGITSGASATGSAATYDIPNTGVRITAASGTYAADDYYTFDTTAGRFASSALSGLFDRVHAKIAQGEPIGAVWPVQEDADAIAGRVMLDALSTELTTSRSEKFYLWGLYQLPREEPDADVLTYCGTFVDPYIMCSVGDFRARGGLLSGARFHRPASWVAAWKAARDRFSSDLGNRQDRALNTAFGVTEIGRDERTATTKLATFRTPQTGDGGGFLALETPSNSAGEAYFYRGRTMAQAGSVLGDGGSMRLLMTSARQAQRTLDLFVNSDPPRRANGSLVDEDSIRDQIESPLRAVLFDDPEAEGGHASALSVGLPSYSNSTKTMSVNIEIKRNAQVKAVSANIGVDDGLSVTEQEV